MQDFSPGPPSTPPPPIRIRAYILGAFSVKWIDITSWLGLRKNTEQIGFSSFRSPPYNSWGELHISMFGHQIICQEILLDWSPGCSVVRFVVSSFNDQLPWHCAHKEVDHRLLEYINHGSMDSYRTMIINIRGPCSPHGCELFTFSSVKCCCSCCCCSSTCCWWPSQTRQQGWLPWKNHMIIQEKHWFF